MWGGVPGRDFAVAASSQTPALGAAMFAAVAAGTELGGHASIVDASRRMAHLATHVFRPVDAHHEVYSELYREYVRLHDLFGRDEESVMKTLRRIRHAALEVGRS